MKLRVKNIGRLHGDNEIDINGITVLCGENGTGKSTIGKVLYCTFNSFHDFEEKILEDRVGSILRSISFFSRSWLTRGVGTFRVKETAIRDMIELYRYSHNDEIIDKFVDDLGHKESTDIDDSLKKRIIETIETDDIEILKAIVSRNIDEEFGAQIGHINYPNEKSEIELCIKDEKIQYTAEENRKIDILKKMNLVKNVVYIDDPYILDDMWNRPYRRGLGHRYDLVEKIINVKNKNNSAVDDVIANKRLEKVYEKLDDFGIGSLEDDSESGMVYAEKGLKKSVSVVNISTGIKSFVIIKSLLQKGFLEENGIVILDEPETNLNPEGMFVYAEIVVLLHDLLGINFVISSHSADFISFIEYFTKKYNVADKTKYYLLAKNTDMTTNIEDISKNLECIYSKLARPFLKVSEELDILDET